MCVGHWPSRQLAHVVLLSEHSWVQADQKISPVHVQTPDRQHLNRRQDKNLLHALEQAQEVCTATRT